MRRSARAYAEPAATAVTMPTDGQEPTFLASGCEAPKAAREVAPSTPAVPAGYIPGTGSSSSTSMDAPSIIRCGWPSSSPSSSPCEPASISE